MRLVVVLLFCFGSVALADNFNQGLKSYRHSNFSAAERAFLRVLQEGVNRATRAKVYKYIGLSQYMLGRKGDASSSFRSALRFDPLTELYPNEVLDSSVLEFFLQIKQESRKKPPPTAVRRPPVRKPLAKKPLVKKPYVPRVPMAGERRSAVRGKPAVRQPATKRVISKKPPTKTPITKHRKSTDGLFGTKKPKRISFGKKTRQPTARDNRSNNSLLLPSNKKLSTSSSGGVTALHFMPFGAGQFVNNSQFALPFLLAQSATLLTGGFMLLQFIDRKDEMEADEGYQVTKNLSEKNLEQKEYLKEYDAYVNEPKLWSYVSLAGFGVLWAGSVVEAIVNRPLVDRYGVLVPDVHYRPNDSSLAFVWQIPW